MRAAFPVQLLSGVLIWGNLSDGLPAWIYSLTYNGSYMLPEGIMTTIAVVLLYKLRPSCSALTTDFAIFNSVCLGCHFYGVPGFFYFLFSLICPVTCCTKSFYHADITFFRPARQPHRTFFALHQQLPVSAANYYRNAFLYSFFKCIFVAIF